MYLSENSTALSERYNKIDGVYVSAVETVDIEGFMICRSKFCKMYHQRSCKECDSLVKFAEFVKIHGLVQLSETYKKCLEGEYKSTHAVRRIMQIPVVIFTRNGQLYVTNKKQGCDYKEWKNYAGLFLEAEDDKSIMDKKILQSVCALASSSKYRDLIRYVAFSGQGFSGRSVRNTYGSGLFNKKTELINDSLVKAEEIKDAVETLADIQSQSLFQKIGLNLDSDSGDSENDWIDVDFDEDSSQFSCRNEETIAIAENQCSRSLGEDSNATYDPDAGLQKEFIVDPTPSNEHLLMMLRENNLNWFSLLRSSK